MTCDIYESMHVKSMRDRICQLSEGESFAKEKFATFLMENRDNGSVRVFRNPMNQSYAKIQLNFVSNLWTFYQLDVKRKAS